MKPTEGPDAAMPEQYGMYDEYEGYDEDEFFYHMYFDEVSTTPLPDEFYDILESVSNSGDNSFSNYPEYFDYILKSGRTNTSDSEVSTQPSPRQSKNKRYLNFGDETSPGKTRRNSKFLKFKRRKQENNAAGTPSRISKRSIFPSNKYKYEDEDSVRKKRSSRGHKKRKQKKKNRVGFRKRKQIEPGIIGILDRRVPVFFRQSAFVTIALTQFVVLSTGVTTGRRETSQL